MIYIYPIGGLGNMFFHIASIWTLAKDNNDVLGLLNIEGKIKQLDNATNITTTWSQTKHSNEYRYLFNRFPNVNQPPYKSIDHPFRYYRIPYTNECQYNGYFQCEEYFKHRRDEIIDLFLPPIECGDQIESYSHLFGNIGLHVRRSWIALGLLNVFVAQTIEYYNKAISMLPKDLKIVIFSDDLDWCKQNFIGDRFIFVDEVDYIVIYLMMNMRYNIIANSSFSWWGAWMSDAEQIIAPKGWFNPNPEFSAEDIVPKNWIRV